MKDVTLMFLGFFTVVMFVFISLTDIRAALVYAMIAMAILLAYVLGCRIIDSRRNEKGEKH